MQTVCGAGPLIRGVDVSHWEPIINWTQVKQGGLGFVFLKCSEGLNYIDQSFDEFSRQCTANNIAHGAYHFFHPNMDPLEQAAFFLKNIGPTTGNLPCVLDIESEDNEPSAEILASALKWLQAVEQATGKTPVVYGSPYFLEALGGGPELARYPLWVAHYGVNCPSVPAPWTNWIFWQFSSSYPVFGVQGKCDVDSFNGDLDALRAFSGLPFNQKRDTVK